MFRNLTCLRNQLNLNLNDHCSSKMIISNETDLDK